MPKQIINGTPAGEKLYAPNHADCIVNGNGGDDQIFGGYKSTEELRLLAGGIIFAGYSSRDNMWGGGGPAKFIFANPSQSPDQGNKRATINDFKSSDRIEIFWATADTCEINWTPVQGGKVWRITWTYKGSQGGIDDDVPDMAVDVIGDEPTIDNFTFGSAADYP